MIKVYRLYRSFGSKRLRSIRIILTHWWREGYDRETGIYTPYVD